MRPLVHKIDSMDYGWSHGGIGIDAYPGDVLMDLDKIEQQLIRDEGLRLKLYKDSLGIASIGVGRNLDHNGIRESEARLMLRNDVNAAINDCRSLSCFSRLNEPRQAVLVNLMFNIGLARLRGFKKMLAALDDMDYATASAEMLDSLWAKQVGPRALRLSEQMKKGEWVS